MYIVSGIQQIGIGIPDVEGAWDWYRCRFGMNVPIFREAAEAPLMTAYTGGTVHSRDALLAVNLQGGGGFEIWQYTSRSTVFPDEPPLMGDLGIIAVRIKSPDVFAAHRFFSELGMNVIGTPLTSPDGGHTFFLKDPWGNLFQIVHADDWFGRKRHVTGGPSGALLGVTDMEKSLRLYRNVLGFDTVIYDVRGRSKDWMGLPGGKDRFRRVLLTRSAAPAGPFSPLFGHPFLELVQTLDRDPVKIFDGRLWGDGGFIHLCFDIQGMDELGEALGRAGFRFTVDSKETFDMGEASGRFTYVEDPDGTLIEFVETHKVPIMKNWGWYLNLTDRPRAKALPRIVIRALGLGRKKGGCDRVRD